MANPREHPQGDDMASGSHSIQPSADRDWTRGVWYLLLIPVACLYAWAAREFAGPGFTGAPNQGAMVVFFLLAVAWPFIAIGVVAIIRRVAHIRGMRGDCLGFLSWIVSSAVPFLIGMK